MKILKNENYNLIKNIAKNVSDLEENLGRSRQAKIEKEEALKKLIVKYSKEYKKDYRIGGTYTILYLEKENINNTIKFGKWIDCINIVVNFKIEQETPCYYINKNGRRIKKEKIICVVE